MEYMQVGKGLATGCNAVTKNYARGDDEQTGRIRQWTLW